MPDYPPKGWREVDDRYRVVDTFDYLDRQDVYGDLTLTEAAAKFEDLTGVEADVILSDFDEPDRRRWEWTDDETGREVALIPEAERDPPRESPIADSGLLDDPVGRCSGCGRATWERSYIGQRCGMIQPNGGNCDGTFVAEAGGMSTTDGLGARRQGEVYAVTDPENWPDGRPTFGRGR